MKYLKELFLQGDGLTIMYYDFDQLPNDLRTGSMLTIIDTKLLDMISVTSEQYSKKTLSDLCNELQAYKEKKFELETLVPIFKKYGLRD